MPTVTGVKSVDTRPARQAYEAGVSLRVIQRRYHLTDGELHDVAPEEFDDEAEEFSMGGY